MISRGIRRGEIKNKRRESNSAIAINQGSRRVPLVNSRKAQEIARGIIWRGGWSISEEGSAQKTTVIHDDSILRLEKRRKYIIVSLTK